MPRGASIDLLGVVLRRRVDLLRLIIPQVRFLRLGLRIGPGGCRDRVCRIRRRGSLRFNSSRGMFMSVIVRRSVYLQLGMP